ncbi:Adenine phosphoribosyltransferase, putative [Bodo saltans]|uniref:adenine phosphoribosyltransferase n=1 Tax=Bodo saltans TaxID=75058 RepID=A0A0S4IJH4_BODSA|nr:Adenine phosphoribosyltransferase, putative [Bodo saltans]|eukprot:CUE85912.1 Adenine phosphoribosyltransferase, putative [Bodo saltans]
MEVIEISPKYYTLQPEGELAKQIASQLTWFSPKFSPKDVPRFYDISAVTENPALFQAVVKSMSARYRSMGDAAPTHVLGFDARGFLLGAPIAYELGIPFVMMRKAEKSPGVLLRSEPYHKEYAEAHPDTMAIRKGSIGPGSRVVLVDDLIATGGTAISGFQLVEASGATVVEFAAVIGIPFLDGVAKIHSEGNGKFKDVPVFTLVHDSAITEKTCGDPSTWEEGKSRVIAYSDAIKQLQQ